MTGGYLAAWLVGEQGWPFAWGLLAAVVLTGLLGMLLEALVLRRLYRRSELEQVLFTIGLTFLSAILPLIYIKKKRWLR